jgi:WD40 repeat protein
VWGTRDWRLESTFSGHRTGGHSVAFSPEGETLASVDGYGIIDLWNVHSGSKDTIASGQARNWCTSFSPDGRMLATISSDASVKLWDVAHDRGYVPITITSALTPSIAFARDGKTLTVVDDKASLKRFETLDGHLIETERFDQAGPNFSVALSSDATTLLTATNDTRCFIWDVRNHRRLFALPVSGAPLSFLAVAPDGRWITGQGKRDQDVRLWSSTGAVEVTLEGVSGSDFLFSPGGDFLSNYGWSISEPHLWEVGKGKGRRAKHAGHRVSIGVEAFAADGRSLATGGSDGSIILWSVPELERRAQFPKDSVSICSLAFSPDGRSLVTGYENGLVRIWDINSCMELATLEVHSGAVVRACFSPDGSILATCADNTGERFEIFLWKVKPAP